MSERILPCDDSSFTEYDLALTWSQKSHPDLYTLVVPPFTPRVDVEDSFIPRAISNDLQNLLGEKWQVQNHGTRLEILSKPYGNHDHSFVGGIVQQYFEELGQFSS